MLSIGETTCCALQQIDGLSYQDSPELALASFIRTARGYTGSWGSGKNHDVSRYLGAFYTFTGVEAVDPELYEGGEEQDDGDDHYHYDNNPGELDVPTGYGSAFAALIRKHNLGTLTESPICSNRGQHPSHMVQVWVWAPDPVALQKYYDKYLRKDKE